MRKAWNTGHVLNKTKYCYYVQFINILRTLKVCNGNSYYSSFNNMSHNYRASRYGFWGGTPSLKIALVKGQQSLTHQGVEVYLTRPMMTVSGLCLRIPLIKHLTLIDRTSISVVAAIYLPTKELSAVLSSWVNQTQSRSLLPQRCLWCPDWLRKMLYIVEADSNLFWYVSLLV